MKTELGDREMDQWDEGDVILKKSMIHASVGCFGKEVSLAEASVTVDS